MRRPRVDLPRAPTAVEPVTVHRYHTSHAWEQQQAALLTDLWRAWWPGVDRLPVTDADTQRAGVDAVLTGPTCAQPFAVEVEEKIRSHDYGDVLLEVVSNDQAMTPGWAVKGARSKLLLYAWAPTRRGFVFPMQTVQRVTRANADLWLARFGVRLAKNDGYTSHNVPVPLSVFAHAIDQAHGIVFCPACRMVCDWSDLRGPSWCSMCRPAAAFEVRLETTA